MYQQGSYLEIPERKYVTARCDVAPFDTRAFSSSFDWCDGIWSLVRRC